jgi:hypothetical protein
MMKKNRASQIVVLCEDKLHDVFVTRFLGYFGFRQAELVVLPYPRGGRGAGESFVRREYPQELLKYGRRRARAVTALIAVIDADTGSLADRHADLMRACQEAEVDPRKPGDLVVHAIPRRAINTWLAYLDGVNVDEGVDYKKEGYRFDKCEAEASRLIKRLHEMCKAGDLPVDAPPSLKQACVEFARIKDHLR